MHIEIRNLVKKYGEQAAVDDVSFELKSGEILGFLGPNGAGKTTTMRIISCFMAPTSGDVLLDGTSVFNNPVAFRKRIGYLPENNPLYYDMFITDFLEFMAGLQQMEKSRIHRRIKETIDFVGLGAEKHKKIGELSKGYKQRVGLAQALLHDPELLILDEPTSGLDPNQIIEIRDLIRNLGKHKTIILSTHILQEVEAVCDRLIIINKGKIAADSTPGLLQLQMSGGYRLQVEIEADVPQNKIEESLRQLEHLLELSSISSKKAHFQLTTAEPYLLKKKLFELCAEKKWYLLELHQSETRLEDIFRQLTIQN